MLYPKVTIHRGGSSPAAPHSFFRRHQKLGSALASGMGWLQDYGKNSHMTNKAENKVSVHHGFVTVA
eukprot:1097597-Prorocentrum_minimum.AAC.1